LSQTSAANLYFAAASDRLQTLQRTQLPRIQAAAQVCADSIREGGLVFLFGCGHSRFLCDEMAPRQGCFVGFVPIAHTALSTYTDVVGPNGLRPTLFLERYEGYAEHIFEGYQFGPHDVLIVISTSGIRPVPIEMAQHAKRRGLKVIAIVSEQHCRSAAPAHSSGQKLIDVAEIVLDNCCPPGDCIVELDGLDWRTGPLSTVTGAMIINMLRCETAELLLAAGFQPTMFPSHQLTGNHGAEEQIERFYTAYRKSIARLYSS
jgi:uncharacterized phosphosugar-binding protein